MQLTVNDGEGKRHWVLGEIMVHILSFFKSLIITFFQDGVWVLGFFYLLNKFFEDERLKLFSKYVILVILALLFLYSVIKVTGTL
ncbi:UNVERIFIED_ORG: hypothetical protein QFZ59_002483 [Bacillus sp. B2I3]|nr:hypothetical protein [Bacillus sp. B2I3]